jgi:hypothetical protein
VSSGHGLLIHQPNAAGTIDYAPPGFGVTILSEWWCGIEGGGGSDVATIVDDTHPIVAGLVDGDVSGAFDFVGPVGSGYALLTRNSECGDPALLAGSFGAGHVAFEDGNASPGSDRPGGDAYWTQLFTWLGTCNGTEPLTCDDDNPCTTDTCDAVAGCQHPAVANGTACVDGTVCNGAETCQAGVCTAGTALTCDNDNPCTTDTCDPVAGCQHAAVTNGTACSDGNACTQTDTCQAGACVGGNPIACVAADQCHVAGTCDAATGVCSQPVKPDGTTCDDGDACTTGDTCQTGGCQPGPRVACIPAPDGPIVLPGPAPVLTLNVERPPSTTTTSAVVTVAGYAAIPAGLTADAFGADGAPGSAALPLAVRRHRNPCSATTPPGTVQMTNCVRKLVKRRESQVPVKLRLNKLGRKLLSEPGGFVLQVAGSVTEPHGGSSPLAALLKLLRRR